LRAHAKRAPVAAAVSAWGNGYDRTCATVNPSCAAARDVTEASATRLRRYRQSIETVQEGNTPRI
jgi:hypothetical protein